MKPPSGSHDDLRARVSHYYTSALDRHGPTARGVDWNSETSQHLRFDQLAKVWQDRQADDRQTAEVSLIDYGCGYGALVSYLRDRGAAFRYAGFDISSAMVDVARQLHQGPDVAFFTESSSLPAADYAVASGIFNVKLDTPEDDWLEYVLDTIEGLSRLASKGFAFNVLSRYSDPERRRSDLFYADPLFLFDHCKRRFSKGVALLHHYPLYEFTILVRGL